MMIRRVLGLIVLVVILMGSLSAHAASTLTFSCNSNPPLNLTLISFSFDVDKAATTRGSEPSHHKVNSMTIRFPMGQNNTALQRLMASNENLKTCQLTEGVANQEFIRKEAVTSQDVNRNEAVTNQAFNQEEKERAVQEWTFKNVRVTALTTKIGETSGVKGANSNSKSDFWQATLTYEEATLVKK